jgi:hypothetical protein
MSSDKAERSSIEDEANRRSAFVARRSSQTGLDAVSREIANAFGQVGTNENVETNADELLVGQESVGFVVFGEDSLEFLSPWRDLR